MAKKLCGEASLRVGARTVRLRLDIGTMMDLEDHFGMGLVPFLSTRLPEFRLKDMAVLYLAMTGGDFGDAGACKKAAEKLVLAGLAEAAAAIAGCLEATLQPEKDQAEKDQPEGPREMGKPAAGRTARMR